MVQKLGSDSQTDYIDVAFETVKIFGDLIPIGSNDVSH